MKKINKFLITTIVSLVPKEVFIKIKILRNIKVGYYIYVLLDEML
ncbi:hypothetical protein EMIT079MI2_450002 [Bacillus sp. IT-79MI2]